MPDETQTESAFVLPQEAAPTTEVQVLGNFPGRYTPGQPVALSELPISEDDAADAIADMPLEQTTVAAGEGKLPVDPQRIPNEDEAAQLAAEEVEERAEQMTRSSRVTRADLDARARELGLDPEPFKTKADLAAAIAEREQAAAAAGEPTGEGAPGGTEV